ncbi:MAG: DUF3226 domain-containing protein [Methylococcaceae bacterium]
MEKNFKNIGDDKKILLVEGINDCHVIKHLCLKHSLKETFKTYDCGGYEELIKKIQPILKLEKHPDIIGMVVDADKPEDNPNLNSVFQSISDRLKKVCNAYSIPKNVSQGGIIIPAVDIYPKIGIWFMPNNSDIGMLENFLMKLAINTNEDSLNFARECVQSAKDKGFTSFRDVQHAKAIIHTYLAWHDEPGDTLGKAIRASNIDSHAPLAIDFINWLKELFEISENE